MENTIDVNQNPFTASASGVPVVSNENCNVVAVTAEKNVATVDRLRRLFAPCFCAKRIVGTPKDLGLLLETTTSQRNWRTNLNEHAESLSDRLNVLPHLLGKIM